MKRGRDLLKPRTRFSSLSVRTFTSSPRQMDPLERYSYNPILRWNSQVEEYFIKAYGADRFDSISKALTRPSCYSCIRVNTLKTTSDAIIGKLLSILQERGLENVSDGTCGKNGADLKLNMVLNKKCTSEESNLTSNLNGQSEVSHRKPNFISKCHLPGLDYVVFVKGSGPHEIKYMQTTERPIKEVIVSRKCAEAVLRGAQVYIPGVLACSAHVEKGDVVAVSVAVEQPDPDGGWRTGITRGTVLQGSQIDPHYIERNGLYIGQGTTTMSRAGIFRVSEGVAINMKNRVFELSSFNDMLEGEIFLQNLPSIITAHAFDPQQGERVLDMCAAPGGKTTAIAILMKDKGEVVAVDRSHNKVLDIQKLADELGLNCIRTYKLDALKAVNLRCDSDDITTTNGSDNIGMDNDIELSAETTFIATKDGGEQAVNGTYASKASLRKNNRRMRNGPGRNHRLGGRVEKSQGFSPNSFDRVLLDAPCSALGLRPRLFAREETVESLRNHAKYQRRMFDQAVQLVRPGGVLVYSTCTISPGENEALVRYALDTYRFLSLAPQRPRIGGPGLIGGCEISDGYVENWLRPGEENLVQRFDPSSPLDTIGFFIAKFHVGPKDA